MARRPSKSATLPWDAAQRDPLGLAAFVDVETTGLDSNRDEVVELALVLFAFDRETGTIAGIVDEYIGLREPARPIPPDATAIHHITHRMVKGRRLDDRRVRDLLDKAEFLIAHNAQFDYSFVVRLYPEAAQKVWLCSMRGIAWSNHGYRSRSLQNLLAAHGIKVDRAHRAGADCHAAIALLGCRGLHGDTYLLELMRGLPARPVRVPSRAAALASRTPQAKRSKAEPGPKRVKPDPTRAAGTAGCATVLCITVFAIALM
ncbi:MAG: hypothetical protein IRZ18_09170, partial [Clostridia bacterium]|nr:hypothetical protein [Clostridia bacterium]